VDSKGIEIGVEMDQGAVIIIKERVRSLREMVKASDDVASCIENLKEVLEIESKQLSRAEASCCVGVRFEDGLRSGVQLLTDALHALKEGDVDKAASLLGKYERIAE